MKKTIRIVLLTLVIGMAFGGNSFSGTPTLGPFTPSSVPGGAGPMPTCNPFTTNCPTIR